MEVLAQFGGGAYGVVALVIGSRLVLLSTRTRALPELLVGLGVLLLAGLGYPLSAVAREVPDLSPGTRTALGATAALLAVVGVSANTAFIWVLFRRGAGWALGLVGGVALVAVAVFAAQTIAGNWGEGRLFWSVLSLLVTVSFGWAFVECGRYHGLMRRRLRLGLADPVVTDRFLLYAVATGLAVLTNVAGQAFWFLGVEMISDPLGGFLLFSLGTSSSTLMLLAFLPPRTYLEWVRARAPQVA